MLEIQFSETDGVLILRPNGRLTAEDFQSAAKEADRAIEARGELNGVMIDAAEFPGWQDFAALSAHLNFVRDHQKAIRKLAVVSDSGFATALPAVARHFVSASIRKFPASGVGEAMTWLATPADDEASPLRYTYFPDENLFWATVNGKITTEDYKKMLTSMGDAIDASPERLNFLVDINDLDGMELGAMWEDAKFGFSNLDKVGRVAMVGDQKWLEKVAKLADPLTKIELKSFKEDDEYDAWQWING